MTVTRTRMVSLDTLYDRLAARIAKSLTGSSLFGGIARQLTGATGTNGTREAAGSAGRAADPSAFAGAIASASARYNVPADLVRAVIRAESGFNPQAQSSVGAKGLMQLMDGTARALGVTDSFDPQQNIEGGVKYLHQMLERFGSVPLAVAAYNAGPGAVEHYGGIPPYAETQTYVRRVLSMCDRNWEA